jgi:hypothetical protein
MRRQKLLVAGGAIALLAALMGCASAADSEVTPSPSSPGAFLNQQLSVLTEVMPDDNAGLLVRDLSPEVGKDASYNDNVINKGAWRIVGICASATPIGDLGNDVEVGVVPYDASLKKVEVAEVKGTFKSYLTCEGRPRKSFED